MTKLKPLECSSVEIHQRKVTCRFDRVDLRLLVAEAAAKAAGVELSGPGVDFDVKFEDVTEGSPSYRVGTKATATITIDMLAAHAVEDKSPTDEPG
jgi:hypothetical protein